MTCNESNAPIDISILGLTIDYGMLSVDKRSLLLTFVRTVCFHGPVQ